MTNDVVWRFQSALANPVLRIFVGASNVVINWYSIIIKLSSWLSYAFVLKAIILNHVDEGIVWPLLGVSFVHNKSLIYILFNLSAFVKKAVWLIEIFLQIIRVILIQKVDLHLLK